MASSFLKGAAFFEQAGEEEEKRQERIVAKAAGNRHPSVRRPAVRNLAAGSSMSRSPFTSPQSRNRF